MRKKSPVQFEVFLSGDGLSPDGVPASELCGIVLDLEKAILSTAAAVKGPAPCVVSLSEVRGGSIRLSFGLSGTAVDGVSRLASAVKSRTFATLPHQAHEALHNVSRRIDARGWKLGWRAQRSARVSAASISSGAPVPPPPGPRPVRGTTTLYGRLVRVGGESPKALVKLASGQTLSVDLDETQACELGHRLYQDVGLEGDAVWNGESWELQSFRVRRVTAYRRSDAVHAFAQLASAAKGRWDSVNAASFVRALRADGSK